MTLLLLLSNVVGTGPSVCVRAFSNSAAVPNPPVIAAVQALTVPVAFPITGSPSVIAPLAIARTSASKAMSPTSHLSVPMKVLRMKRFSLHR